MSVLPEHSSFVPAKTMQSFDTSVRDTSSAMGAKVKGTGPIPVIKGVNDEKPLNPIKAPYISSEDMKGFDMVSESAKGEAKKPGFNVFNRFGKYGKGEFEFKYGLNAPAVTGFNQVKEKSIVIQKKGVKSCPKGQTMTITGDCVPVIQDLSCEPGWIKENGVCVKGPTEFQEAVKTKKGIPQYYQELQKNDKPRGNGGLLGLGVVLVLIGLVGFVLYMVRKGLQEEKVFEEVKDSMRYDPDTYYGFPSR